MYEADCLSRLPIKGETGIEISLNEQTPSGMPPHVLSSKRVL